MNMSAPRKVQGHSDQTLGLVCDSGWLEQCATNGAGKALPTLANAMRALRYDPALHDVFAFDQMLQTTVLLKPLNLINQSEPDFAVRTVIDVDVTELQEWLQLAGLRHVNKATVHDAIDLRASERAFHPMRNHLLNIEWDEHFRLDSWLADYLGAERNEYTKRIGRMFLIAMVARIFEPGCKSDHMIVLEGEQGSMKSSACEVLGCGYFSDSLPEVGEGKDVSQHLRGKFLIEVSEMHAMNRAETAQLKAFITRTDEIYRPSFGRLEVVEPRQCVFIGTTNNSTYLRDETGGRRFWPVKIGNIDVKALRAERDQLFAEAVKCYVDGEKWHPDAKFEREHIYPEQDDRFEPDAWEAPIRDYLKESKPQKIYLGDIFQHALEIEVTSRDRAKQNRVTGILTRLKWNRLKKDSKGNIPWGPPDPS